METVSPLREIEDEIKKVGGTGAKLCYECGKCDVVCPWNRVGRYSMRKTIRQANFGLPEIELDDIWRCTTCGSCPRSCPRGVEQIEVARAVRRIASEYGVFPGAAKPLPAIGMNLISHGNPMGEERSKRADWADGLGIKPFAEGMEILYFVGCYYSHDARNRKVAVATAKLLQRAGVDFGTLGTKESCCGESIRKTGNETAFKKLARDNIKAFIDSGVTRILVSSPHCYHTFKNEYSEFMMKLEVVHITQFLRELIADGRLKVSGQLAKRVTYHDPCYLGRHTGVFDPPRELLEMIPGLELVEMPDNREKSLCCGGGGGRIWMHTDKDERFGDIRVAQAREVEADLLVTSCPYCISNFEESRLALLGEDDTSAEGDGQQEGVLVVKDLTELLLESLEGAEEAS